ncbi:MAG: hypothetical protein HZB92_02015 [Euryarchaeota archaeon]|nr:hypothetical protein [Euryarchaeota archaeon]
MTVEGQRGLVVKAHLGYVKQQWGAEALRECCGHIGMGYDDIDEDEFYSRDVENAVLTWISRNKGMEHVQRSGHHGVMNLGVYSYLIPQKSIETIARVAEMSYMDTYNYGSIKVISNPREKTIFVQFVAKDRMPENCAAWLGAMQGIFDLAKVRGSVEHIRCVHKGDPLCEYRLRWR